MQAIFTTLLFQVFATVLVLDVLKTLFLGTATSLKRHSLKQYMVPEDADWHGGEAVAVDGPDVRRRFGAHRNNLENLLPFFIVGSLYLASGASATAGIVYFTLFFMGRSIHTIAYLSVMPKLRRNMYTLAWLSTIATGVHALSAILSAGM